jgi:hypothetical protein
LRIKKDVIQRVTEDTEKGVQARSDAYEEELKAGSFAKFAKEWEERLTKEYRKQEIKQDLFNKC